MLKIALLNFKWLLTKIGALTPHHLLHQFQMVVNYMKLGRWMVTNGFIDPHRVRTRKMVFSHLAERIKDQKVLYLEFGVFQGASLKFWSNALKNPDSQLFGFDSFEGLPEDFDVDGPYQKGTFDVQGALPKIDDKRVSFVKGWFENTLPTFVVPAHDTLLITLDADLYSSTVTVLNHLKPWIKKGVFLYFDDMSRPDHEPKAFTEFMEETGLKFSCVVTDYPLNCTIFECIG